nr:integrase, catalytic region, zinc finger, CCHC-type, peptidase aspartic, catalytic [Tanacetum cinerariifolium]
MTGDCSLLKNFVKKFIGTVRYGNDHFSTIMGYGDYVIGDSVISRVFYVERLGHNLFSVGQFYDSDLEVAFRKHSCCVCDMDDVELIKGSRGSMNFVKKFIGTVRYGNDHFGTIMGYGDYVIGDSVISRVFYMDGLGHNLFSVGQFCDSDLEVAFKQHSCCVRDMDGVELIKGSRGSMPRWENDPGKLGAAPDSLRGYDPLALVGRVTPVEDSIGLLETTFDEDDVLMGLFPDEVTGSVNLTFLVLFIGVTAISLSPKSLMQGQSVEIDNLKQTLSEHLKEKESLKQTVTLLKNDFQKEESRNIDRELALEKQIKELNNIVFKRNQSAQTVYMLTKPQFFYDHTTKQALGFQNPFYLKKA